jgi:8-oxo-dGTP diphosphatase
MKTVTAAIAIREQCVFLARRAHNQKLAGFWEFPGGKVEQEETLQECLERELREEFGVPSTAGAILCESIYHYDHGSIRLVGIETALLSTAFVPTVHDQLDWVPLKRLTDIQLAPADIPIAKFLMEHYA